VSRAVLAPQARRDLLEAAAWIAAEQPRASAKFRRAVLAIAARLGRFPASGAERLDLAPEGIRFVSLRGFPHVVVYDSDRRPPLILRVLHGVRDLPEVLSKT